MDIGPISMYRKPDVPILWPTLFNALSQAAITRGVQVRLLISRWQHTSPRQIPFLRALDEFTRVCHIQDNGTDWANAPVCTGQLEIRLFELPGWNESVKTDANRSFPLWSRVNHAKYVVTDRRAHVSTSNFAWGYFFNTAGASISIVDEVLVSKVSSVFRRDWESEYARPLLPQ